MMREAAMCHCLNVAGFFLATFDINGLALAEALNVCLYRQNLRFRQDGIEAKFEEDIAEKDIRKMGELRRGLWDVGRSWEKKGSESIEPHYDGVDMFNGNQDSESKRGTGKKSQQSIDLDEGYSHSSILDHLLPVADNLDASSKKAAKSKGSAAINKEKLEPLIEIEVNPAGSKSSKKSLGVLPGPSTSPPQKVGTGKKSQQSIDLDEGYSHSSILDHLLPVADNLDASSKKTAKSKGSAVINKEKLEPLIEIEVNPAGSKSSKKSLGVLPGPSTNPPQKVASPIKREDANKEKSSLDISLAESLNSLVDSAETPTISFDLEEEPNQATNEIANMKHDNTAEIPNSTEKISIGPNRTNSKSPDGVGVVLSGASAQHPANDHSQHDFSNTIITPKSGKRASLSLDTLTPTSPEAGVALNDTSELLTEKNDDLLGRSNKTITVNSSTKKSLGLNTLTSISADEGDLRTEQKGSKKKNDAANYTSTQSPESAVDLLTSPSTLLKANSAKKKPNAYEKSSSSDDYNGLQKGSGTSVKSKASKADQFGYKSSKGLETEGDSNLLGGEKKKYKGKTSKKTSSGLSINNTSTSESKKSKKGTFNKIRDIHKEVEHWTSHWLHLLHTQETIETSRSKTAKATSKTDIPPPSIIPPAPHPEP